MRRRKNMPGPTPTTLPNLGVTQWGETLNGDVNQYDLRVVHVYADSPQWGRTYVGDIFDTGAQWEARPMGRREWADYFTTAPDAATYLGSRGVVQNPARRKNMARKKRRPLVATAKKALAEIADQLRADLEAEKGNSWNVEIEESVGGDSGFYGTAFITPGTGPGNDGYSLNVTQWGSGENDFSANASFFYEYEHGQPFRNIYSDLSYTEVKKYLRRAAKEIFDVETEKTTMRSVLPFGGY